MSAEEIVEQFYHVYQAYKISKIALRTYKKASIYGIEAYSFQNELELIYNHAYRE